MALGTPTSTTMPKIPTMTGMKSTRVNQGSTLAGLNMPVLNSTPPTTTPRIPSAGTGYVGTGGVPAAPTLESTGIPTFTGDGPGLRRPANAPPFTGYSSEGWEQRVAEQQYGLLRDYIASQLGSQAGQYTTAADDYEYQRRAAERRAQIEQGNLRINADNAMGQLDEGRYRDVDVAAARNLDAHRFTGREWSNLLASLGANREMALRGNQISRRFFDQAGKLTDEGFRQANQRSQYAREFAYEDASSATAGAGTFLSNALNRPLERADVSDMMARQAAGLERDTAWNSINRGVSEANLGYDRQMQELRDRENAGALKRDREYADQERTHQYLVSLAKTYGLRADDIRNGLAQGLQRLGLDAEETMARLAAARDSNNKQAAAIAQMIQQQALALAGQ